MTLQQLSYVIAISETGSFSRAAEKLYITQPSLTSAVKALEEELGIVLFNRSARGVTLTAEGLQFLPRAKQIDAQYQALLEAYGKQGRRRQQFAVSTQHYSFAVKAFVEMARSVDVAEYEFAIRETRTRDTRWRKEPPSPLPIWSPTPASPSSRATAASTSTRRSYPQTNIPGSSRPMTAPPC